MLSKKNCANQNQETPWHHPHHSHFLLILCKIIFMTLLLKKKIFYFSFLQPTAFYFLLSLFFILLLLLLSILFFCNFFHIKSREYFLFAFLWNKKSFECKNYPNIISSLKLHFHAVTSHCYHSVALCAIMQIWLQYADLWGQIDLKSKKST